MKSQQTQVPLQNTGYADLDLFLDDCFKTMREKGHDYRQGNDDDLLHNFRTVSDSVGIDITKVWYTYFYKHYSAMVTFIKEGGQSESEPIEGRIKDQIVYLLLFYRMVQEKKAKSKEKAENLTVLLRNLDFSFGQNSQVAEKGSEADAVSFAESQKRKRIQELAGIPDDGIVIPTAFAERATEIVKELAERDAERVSDTSVAVVGYGTGEGDHQ
jgi:hypothetical protein